MKFQFMARSAEQSLTLQVSLDYRPGRQGRRARRLAVGELLAQLEIDEAAVRIEDDLAVVKTKTDRWVIGEGGAVPEHRGAI